MGKFPFLLRILDVRWGFHTIKIDVADTLFEILEVWGTGSIMELH